MAIVGTTEWQGERENYDFDVYEFGGELPEDSGVYLCLLHPSRYMGGIVRWAN